MEVAYVIAKRPNLKVKLKNKHKPKISGKTVDGKLVIGNLFFIVESHGVLLEEAINLFYSNDFVIDWISFYEDSLKKQWNTKTTILKILYSFEESDYQIYRDETIKLLKYYISQRSPS